MPVASISDNEQIQRKINALPEGGTLVFRKDVTYVDPAWQIRKSIVIEGELHVKVTGTQPQAPFRLPSSYDRTFIMTAPTIATFTDPARKSYYLVWAGS